MPLIKDPAIRERNALRLFGCSEAEAVALNGALPLREPRSDAMRYEAQCRAAKRRGVAWSITFREWLAVWSESGLKHLRGVGKGRYCMARHGDIGPYSVGNVSIQLCTKNSSDGWLNTRARRLCRGGSPRVGSGRGWTQRGRAYQVMVGRRYVGTFHTQEAAEDAYKAAVHELRSAVLR